MTERLVSHLRYAALAVPDYEEERDFFIRHWGLTEAHSEDGLTYLAAEGSSEPFILRLRRDEKRIDLAGFGVRDRADIHALADKLRAEDVQFVHEPQELTGFSGGYGFRVFDGDGRVLEFSTGYQQREARKIREREPIPAQLSHFVFNSSDLNRTAQWYVDHLDFTISDSLVRPDGTDMMHFMRCNPNHHSIAIATGPHHSLHHLSFEMRGIEEWMRGAGKILRSGARMIWGPGRHNAGDNTFAYFLSPAGNTIEYTTELQVLDEKNWTPGRHDISHLSTQDQWGTAAVMSELVARESFNDIDKGLFVAPPV
ncbi:oxidoreductase [Microbacterium caowuchunii]|uniref:VOC family protein n=1 Tax=Microbacterium caowuchunii TaxID=2614638 RepID=UPI00124483B4|nr:VOC family protein [Microbacterium caowuchunii]QEW01091.1 oxidoreductase [Microbacterium caowuchunii]